MQATFPFPFDMPVHQALAGAARALSGASDTARLDAELLMAHALGIDRSALLLRQADLRTPASFAALVNRRLAHEPVAYITGRQAFWDLELTVTPDVLIPRADSETLIEAALDAFAGGDGPAYILDLGTGSGALLLAALSAFPDAQGVGVDASEAALQVARGNAEALGFADRATLRPLDWCAPDWETAFDRPFDLILCNPPYIAAAFDLAPMVADYEPHQALFAGDKGLDDYRCLLPHMAGLLTPEGVAVFEIGFDQAESVGLLAKQAGLTSALRCDLAGHPRCLLLRR
jgi:release factor glutamine methyltransferase